MTDAERRLWKIIRNEPFSTWKFRRQHPIGPYIADFACPEILLIIEIDGGQHCESAKDKQRTTWLEACGWRVVRFWNNEISKDSAGVAEILLQNLLTGSLHRGEQKGSFDKKTYYYAANTLTRPTGDLSHEGEVNS